MKADTPKTPAWRFLILFGALVLALGALFILRQKPMPEGEEGAGAVPLADSSRFTEEEPVRYDESLDLDKQLLIWAQESLKDPDLTLNDQVYDPTAHDDYLFFRFLQRVRFETGIQLKVEDFDSAITIREFTERVSSLSQQTSDIPLSRGLGLSEKPVESTPIKPKERPRTGKSEAFG